ncbi:hypothetical protein JZ751_027534 [Albula glossodonta]|uniref:Rho-GAP domain-containing protein n=1 Tax=Albula glossodonta TaxID=121402 RepID=A0A8T2NJQ3_9TELE|nr:hypothetical protein JZ751_027534 [Albula glossodonta]
MLVVGEGVGGGLGVRLGLPRKGKHAFSIQCTGGFRVRVRLQLGLGVEIPNIQKQRRHLAKLVLDMDSSRTRWQQSSKSSSHPSNQQQGGAKADHLREEMEEAANRMEICRSFDLTVLKAWVEKPSFGKPLEEHLTVSGREIAFPIEACVTMLLECGMQEEGLFRVAPSASKLKKLKASLDCGVLDVQEYSADPHAIAGALKSYLRELPEPLMTFDLYDEWIQASNIQDQDKRLQALLAACEKLPPDNINNFRYLIKFLAKLTEFQDANKMTPGNIAIVLGPNLLWAQTEGNITEMMTTVSLQIVGIIEPIIQHADWFFPGDIEFNLTGNYGSPAHTNHNSNYSTTPSPDMDHAERKQHEQGRRPLSVATDNMMLEFYKKDGFHKIPPPLHNPFPTHVFHSIPLIPTHSPSSLLTPAPSAILAGGGDGEMLFAMSDWLCVSCHSMGVRVMDTSWVSRRGSSTLARKASSTPPSVQAPTASADSLIAEQPGELSASPSPTPPPTAGDRPRSSSTITLCTTSQLTQESQNVGRSPVQSLLLVVVVIFGICSSDDMSSHGSESFYAYPSPGENRPPPPYPTSHHFYPKPPPCPRPVAPGPESVPPGDSPPPIRWAAASPPILIPSSSSSSSSSPPQQLDINSNPKPSCLHLPKPSSLCDTPHAPQPEPGTAKPPPALSRIDPSLCGAPNMPPSAPPPWGACACIRDRGTRLAR